MTRFQRLAACSILLVTSSTFAADPPKKLDVGDNVPGYASTKCGGFDDGVAVGKTTCYTCRAGKEPIFYVFAEKRDETIVPLLAAVDKLVAEHREQGVTGVVNFLGDPMDTLARKQVVAFGRKHGLKNVALTLTADGPKFGLEKGDATVILFENGVITMRHGTPQKSLDEKAIAGIVASSTKTLK